ncbi:MAG: autoinducer binding domain-containing protein [Pseudomonadota bacterium]
MNFESIGNKIVGLTPDPDEFDRLISGAQSEVELMGAAIRLANANGYKYFSIMRLPGRFGNELAAISLMANWPRQLIEEYDKHKLLENSPLISHLNSSSAPLVFDIQDMNEGRKDGKTPEVVELFLSYGFRVGLCFSAHLPDGTVGAVTFVGESHSPSRMQIVELNYLSSLLFSKSVEVCSGLPIFLEQITRLEQDCLQWTSEGKSIEDVSKLSGVSRHTVDLLLQSAAKKLNAVNKVHAVVKAMKKSLID